jgi:hypothetical protein
MPELGYPYMLHDAPSKVAGGLKLAGMFWLAVLELTHQKLAAVVEPQCQKTSCRAGIRCHTVGPASRFDTGHSVDVQHLLVCSRY